MNFSRQGAFARRLLFLLLAMALVGVAAPLAAEAEVCSLGAPLLSRTEPPVERPHLFCGEVNGRDRGSGYHHRPGGRDADGARIGAVIERNGSTGVYVATGIAVREDGIWHEKRGISSFYPDRCTPAQVVASIAHAAANATCRYPNGKWRGPSAPEGEVGDAPAYCRGDDGSPLTLEGYWRGQAERIVRTAYPLAHPRPNAACKVR